MSNKLVGKLKMLPTIQIKRASKSKNGTTKEICFHYAYEDEYIEERSKGMGVAMEMEACEIIALSKLGYYHEMLSELGILCKSRNFSRFQVGEKNYSFLLTDKPEAQRTKIIEAFRTAVLPNLSHAILVEPHVDKTINNDLGGIEVVFEPFSLKALPILKAEIARVLHWRKKFGLQWGLPNTSTHLNSSLELWGKDTMEQSINIQRFWLFLWFAKDFILEISNRKGFDEDYANMLVAIGDPGNTRSKAIQNILFMGMKGTAFNMLTEEGAIPSGVFLDAGGAADQRKKGAFNCTVNGNNPVLEWRMMGTPDGKLAISDEDWYIAMHQLMYAIIEMNSVAWDYLSTAAENETRALEVFIQTVYDKREDDYAELWNLVLLMDSAKATIKRLKLDTKPTHIEPLDIDKVLEFDYSMFDKLISTTLQEPSVFSAPEENLAENDALVSELVLDVETVEPEIIEDSLFLVREFHCEECGRKGCQEDFQLEINDDMEQNDLSEEEAINDRDDSARWCNECYIEHNPEEKDDDEKDEFTCTECSNEFDISEKNMFNTGSKTRAVCDSCFEDLS